MKVPKRTVQVTSSGVYGLPRGEKYNSPKQLMPRFRLRLCRSLLGSAQKRPRKQISTQLLCVPAWLWHWNSFLRSNEKWEDISSSHWEPSVTQHTVVFAITICQENILEEDIITCKKQSPLEVKKMKRQMLEEIYFVLLLLPASKIFL